MPGLARLRARVRGQSVPSVLALGAVSGLAGFCAGPIRGAVLTVAAASGQPVRGAALLAVYAAGMTAPLLALAATWDRLGIGRRRWLRGRGVRLGPVHLHTHSVLSGLIFTGLGVVFLRYQGTAGLTGLLAPPSLDTWNNRLQQAVTTVQAHVPDLALIAAAAARGDRHHGLAAEPRQTCRACRPATTCGRASPGRAPRRQACRRARQGAPIMTWPSRTPAWSWRVRSPTAPL